MNAPMSLKLAGVQAAIIDLDGTMVHTAPDFHVAINRMRGDFGLGPLSIALITEFVGKGSENLIRRVLEVDYHREEAQQHLARALDGYLMHYQEINGAHSTVYPEVREGLEAFKAKGVRLACVTNKPHAFALTLLERKGLREYFELVYGGDSLPRKKPDPLPLLQVCRDFVLEPASVVAIGDSSNDAEAARAAGCRILSVPYGYNHGLPVQEIDSDGIVATLLEAAHLAFPLTSHDASLPKS